MNLTGVDLVPSQIAAAKDELASRGLRADLRVADAGALPFENGEPLGSVLAIACKAHPWPPCYPARSVAMPSAASARWTDARSAMRL